MTSSVVVVGAAVVVLGLLVLLGVGLGVVVVGLLVVVALGVVGA